MRGASARGTSHPKTLGAELRCAGARLPSELMAKTTNYTTKRAPPVQDAVRPLGREIPASSAPVAVDRVEVAPNKNAVGPPQMFSMCGS